MQQTNGQDNSIRYILIRKFPETGEETVVDMNPSWKEMNKLREIEQEVYPDHRLTITQLRYDG